MTYARGRKWLILVCLADGWRVRDCIGIPAASADRGRAGGRQDDRRPAPPPRLGVRLHDVVGRGPDSPGAPGALKGATGRVGRLVSQQTVIAQVTFTLVSRSAERSGRQSNVSQNCVFSSNYRIGNLLDTDVLWVAYQNFFSFAFIFWFEAVLLT